MLDFSSIRWMYILYRILIKLAYQVMNSHYDMYV